MADDNVIINTLERASSSDINTLQAIKARSLATFMAAAFAKSIINPSNITPYVGADLARSLCWGLKVRGDGANGAVVEAGILMQLSQTWPSVPVPPYETGLHYGIAASDLPLVLPVAAGGAWYVIEARVTDVVTVSGFRDIFDVVTETFVPTSVDKVQECHIEVRYVVGTPTQLPAPSGDPWVPLGYSFAPAGGVPAPFDGESFVDLRQQWLDGQDNAGMGAGYQDGIAHDYQLQTLSSPDGAAAGLKLTGHARGRAFGNDYRFEVLPLLDGLAVETEASWAAPASTLVHLYMCPLFTALGVSNLVPQKHVLLDPYQLVRGIPIISTVAPRRMTRENSANITLPTKYQNWFGGVVPAGTAWHVGSFSTTAAGTALIWLAQSSGGRAVCDTLLAPFLNVGSYAAAGGGTFACDLRGKVPPNAKMVRLAWSGNVSGGAVGEHAFIALRRASLVQVARFSLFNFDSVSDTEYGYIDVPVAAHADVDTNLNLTGIVTAGGGNTTTINLSIAGWSF